MTPITPAGYSPKQAAEILGVAPCTIYDWIWRGILPATKKGPKLWMIRKQDLDTFIAPIARKETSC
ncbi:helix-turn-helix domain-containing protein [Mobiluncus porci]|nr:helix-turn-helix domain-containing protein [Mobiluncus porci]